jgi:phytoene dehydrogenase-like protein
LPEERRRTLGGEAWLQQVTVSWQLPDDAGPAEQTVWLTMVPGGSGAQLAAVTDRPAAAPLPIWWSEPVLAERSGKSTAIVSAALEAPGHWADAGAAAAAAVADQVRRVAPDWSGRLVIEVPGSGQSFEQVLERRPDRTLRLVAGPPPRTEPSLGVSGSW